MQSTRHLSQITTDHLETENTGTTHNVIYNIDACDNLQTPSLGQGMQHFNVSLTARDKKTQRQCLQVSFFFKDKGVSKQNQAEIPLLTSLTPYR